MSRTLQRSTLAAILGVVSFADDASLARAAEESDPRRKASETAQADAERNALQSEAPWVTEAIRVTARGTANDYPSALASEAISFQESIASPSDFQDLITRVPGVGATGQNGIFETFSIRGSGANSILILVGGMPITAQRRAGVPVAFVEPALLGDINVTRGPSVAHFGAGALGGAISIEPRWFDAPFVEGGYATSGDESNLTAGYGSDNFSFAASHHEAGDSEAPDGTPLNTSFRRESASLQMRTQLGDFNLDALILPSRTENIGKSNTRFPNRTTTYPEDSHTLGRLRLRHANGFEAALRVHDQYLGTYNQRPGRDDEFAAVSSFDIGSTVQQTLEHGNFTTNIGIEYLGRENVDAYDAVVSVLNRTYSLKNGSEDGWSLFALTDWQASAKVALEFGGRATRNSQDHDGIHSSDTANALTAGLVYSPNDWSRVTANLASGFRFPTLEERFYTGVTAQGEVVGNPDLGSEKSKGIDIGYAIDRGNWGGEIHLWRTNVDDLIQLIDISDDVNGYVNVGHAKLHGGEAALGFTPVDALTLRGSVAVVRGTDNTGQQLYGIPPVTAEIEARYRASAFDVGARFSHRWTFDRPGFEELERDAVNVVDADFRYHFTPALNMQVYLRNAFDKKYFATSDELSTYAPERSIGVNMHWTMQ
ncbi:MAG: TonB-dependent receptor [Dokdonella sp.]|jgi:iron complex outermembrane receptor protein|uniref:TonB-dependent receptor n=1 Tax=Dokdonella sp. TaxID=2291710 RepID=UPI001B42571A|nr:TonB-dependent receptor [Dokdonella sp.]MBK8124301.1 TonB-dependent receptor [Dokdonella sp.]MBP6327284.1 TonB-dependent receptor [Dokdonella sp.]MBP6328831.1 TonB-dependent receptor [Dokdonella sp.]HQV48458.1 TonB-dependent receptor [Dokdonella sp.]